MHWRKERWTIGLGALVLLLLVRSVTAQQIGPNDACRHAKANPGNARQCFTIDLTAVTVIQKNQALCQAVIVNKTATQEVLCAGMTDGDPTTTAGFPVGGDSAILNLGLEAQDGWKCIRSAAATAVATVCILELFQ